jgi:hypothetical protein
MSSSANHDNMDIRENAPWISKWCEVHATSRVLTAATPDSQSEGDSVVRQQDDNPEDPFLSRDVWDAVRFLCAREVEWDYIEEDRNTKEDHGVEEDRDIEELERDRLPTRDEFMDPNNTNGLLVLSDTRTTARPSDICPICREDMDDLSKAVVIVQCGSRHIYHSDCLKSWFDSTSKDSEYKACPTCREKLFKVPNGRVDDEYDQDEQPQFLYSRAFINARFQELNYRVQNLSTSMAVLDELRHRLDVQTFEINSAIVCSRLPDDRTRLFTEVESLSEEAVRLMINYLAVARLAAGGALGSPDREQSEGVRIVRMGELNQSGRRARVEAHILWARGVCTANNCSVRWLRLFGDEDRRFIHDLRTFILKTNRIADYAMSFMDA